MTIPTTLSEAIDTLERGLSDEDRTYIQSLTMYEFIGQTHHFGGMALRNDWRLWHNDHPLAAELTVRGFVHGDDRSGLITSLLWRRVNGEPWSEAFIDDLFETYREHWAKQGVNPDGTPLTND